MISETISLIYSQNFNDIANNQINSFHKALMVSETIKLIFYTKV
jgi:hypothetical protein